MFARQSLLQRQAALAALVAFIAACASLASAASGVESALRVRAEEQVRECFRGYQIGHAYHYDFVSTLTTEKETVMSTLDRRMERSDMLFELSAIITPLAIDETGDMHFQLEFDGAHVRDKRGWERYVESTGDVSTSADGEDDISSSAVDQELMDQSLLEGLQANDFYYTQSCDMSINRIHYPNDDHDKLINMKQALVQSFAHRVLYGRKEFESPDRDHMGPVLMDYTVAPAASAADDEEHDHLQVKSSRIKERMVPWHTTMPYTKEQPEHARTDVPKNMINMDQEVHRDAIVRGGIIHSYAGSDQSHFPANEQFHGDIKRKEEALERHREMTTQQQWKKPKHAEYGHAEEGERLPFNFKADEFNDEDAEMPDIDPIRAPVDWKYTVKSRTGFSSTEHTSKRFAENPDQTASNPMVDNTGQSWQSRVFTDHHVRLTHISSSNKRAASGSETTIKSFREHLHRKYGSEDAMKRWVSATPYTGEGKHALNDDKSDDDVQLDDTRRVGTPFNQFSTSVVDLDRVYEGCNAEDRHERQLAWFELKQIITHDRSATAMVAAHLFQKSTPQRVQRQIAYALGEVGGAHEQRVLVQMLTPDGVAKFHPEVLKAASRALTRSHRPTQETLEHIETMIARTDSEQDPEDAQRVTESQMHATLVYGILANTMHHAGGEHIQTAHDMRMLMLRGLKESGTERHETAYALAIKNSMIDVKGDDVVAFLRQQNVSHVSVKRSRGLNKRKDDGFLEQFLCGAQLDAATMWEGRCEDVNFNAERPANPKFIYSKKMGTSQIYAELNLIFHLDVQVEGFLRWTFDFFVGGELAAFFIIRRFELAGAYIKLYATMNSSRHTCNAGLIIGIYMAYFIKTYYWGLRLGENSAPGEMGALNCRRVRTTCVPNKFGHPDSAGTTGLDGGSSLDDKGDGKGDIGGGNDADNNAFADAGGESGSDEFDAITFFTTNVPPAGGIVIFTVCGALILLNIEVAGGLGIGNGVEIVFAPERADDTTGLSLGGGMALVGYVNPFFFVLAIAEVSISFWIIKVGIGIAVMVVRLGLPNMLALNALTNRLCSYGGLEVGALGGKIYLFIEVGFKWFTKRWKVVLFKWKGLSWEIELYNQSCCKLCTVPCLSGNAWCNFKSGECICNEGWGGEACDIQCPRRENADGSMDYCFNITNINPGVKCTPRPEHEYTDDCECYYGYFGWNCMDECPGLIEPERPCNDNGYCNTRGTCDCYENWFGRECTKTCDETCEGYEDNCGLVCHNPPRTSPEPKRAQCAYTGGFNATCYCFRGFAGEECKAECKIIRGAPCAFHGDCIADEEDILFENARCHCHMGFSGEGCGILDYGGAGRALRVDKQGNATFMRGNLGIFRSGGRDSYSTGAWFKLDELPGPMDGDAIIVTWRLMQIRVDYMGNIGCCSTASGIQDNCLASDTLAKVGEWQYILCGLSAYEASYDAQIWHYYGPNAITDYNDVSTSSNAFFKEIHKNEEYIRPEGVMAVGSGSFVGTIDNLVVFNMIPTDDKVVEWKSDAISPNEDLIAFYAKLDLGSGIVLYDEVNLVTGISSRNHSFWETSGLTLRHGSIYSNTSTRATAIDVLGTSDVVVYYDLDMIGRRIESAQFSFVYEVSNEELCTIEITLGEDELLIHKADYTGVGTITFDLTPEAQLLLRSGTNKVTYKIGEHGENIDLEEDELERCAYQLERSQLIARTLASDTVVETAYDHTRQYVEIGCTTVNCPTPNHKSISGDYTFETWVHRPELLHSWNGMIVSVVPKNLDVYERPWDEDYFRWYEDGRALGPKERGVQAHYTEGGNVSMVVYRTPTAQWFHYALVKQGRSHRVYVNGFEVTRRDCDGTCSTLAGFGNPAYRVRLMSDLMGGLNDFTVWGSAWTVQNLRDRIFQARDMSGALMAFDFEDGHQSDALVVTDRGSHQAHGSMTDGVFRGVLLGAEHDWFECPGASYWYPESPCGAHPLYSRGECTKIGANKGLKRQCDCLEGFAGDTCLKECPGAPEGNVCNKRGTCFFLDDSTVCECDPGYVGDFCEFECPGWDEPWNKPQRICSGFGVCNVTDDGTGATCICEQGSDRYGTACQFEQRKAPDELNIVPCAGCNGEFEWCVDDLCVCRPGFYRVFEECVPPQAASGLTQDQDSSGATTALGLVIFVAVIIVIMVAAFLYTSSNAKREDDRAARQMAQVATLAK